MARPREFDREHALQSATQVFWAKGYAATSTDQLLQAMGIGRQSLYNAFGDKRTLYLEVLSRYHDASLAGHLARLDGADSPLEGIRDLLAGLAVSDEDERALGCLGVCAVGEFSTTDPEITRFRARVASALGAAVAARVREGQALGEIDRGLDVAEAAGFVQLAMTGLQVAARGGATAEAMRGLADFTVGRLEAR